MSLLNNNPTSIIPPLMGQEISNSPHSPVILTHGLAQGSKQQNKESGTSSPAIRRRLNDSGENQHPQQYKKHRTIAEDEINHSSGYSVKNSQLDPHDMNPISASQQQQGSLSNHFTLADMTRAIFNNLPCFYLQFEEDLSIGQLPSTTKVAHLLNHFFRNKWEPSFKGFTLCSFVGKNRLKIGTN
ncbi:unnamed protein product, partial [Rotaria sp. Silwood2]